MIKSIAVLSLLVSVLTVAAQPGPSAVVDSYYPLLRNNFVDTNAYNTVAFIEKRWRIPGNKGFNESIFFVEHILQEAGFKKEVAGEDEGPLTYRIERRKMERTTWDPIDASLTISGDPQPLLQFASNRNMLAINSAATSAQGETAELVDVGKGTVQDFRQKDVRGKIVFGEAGAAWLYTNAVKAGALGVLAYSMPSYNQPEKYVNSIQFQGIGQTDAATRKWAILLSYAAKERLLSALAKGPVQVNVKVKTAIYNADEYTLVANAVGAVKPLERFVFSAHVQEPGANDNATGVATLAEMARATATLIQHNRYKPQRTITFLWGDEIVSTARYIQEDSTRAKGIMWGLSLDMVGEAINKTGGSFLIEKMPDPSAIWTRGNDKHTEWGGRALAEADLFPHYFTDFLISRCRQQAQENGWVVNANPFEGGSDHTPFLQARIPGLLMWHFTDAFYHTDADRLDKVSPVEMRNVGVSALAAAFTLCSADEQTTLFLIKELYGNAFTRLQTEQILSSEAVRQGASPAKEQHILDVWTRWYLEAIGKTVAIPVTPATALLKNKIAETQEMLQHEAAKLKIQLTQGG